MSRFGDGLATGPDLFAAAGEATAQALAPLAGPAPDLVCAFVSGGDGEELATPGERVAAASAARALLGCSAGGVIAGGPGIEGASAVAVWAAVLPEVRVRTFHLEVMAGSETTAGVVGVERDTGGLVVGDLVEVGRTVRLQVRDAEAADANLRGLLAPYRPA